MCPRGINIEGRLYLRRSKTDKGTILFFFSSRFSSIKFTLTNPKGRPPARATAGSAGIDLYQQEQVVLHAGERATLDLGVCFHLPSDVCGILAVRSWAANKLRVVTGIIGECLG